MYRYLLFSLLVFGGTAGCDSSEAECAPGAVECDLNEGFDIDAYVGTYAGTRSFDEAAGQTVEDITVRIVAYEASGAISLFLRSPRGLEEIRGTYDANGIDISDSYAGSTIAFVVGLDGGIVGTASGGGQSHTVSGTLTATRLDLTYDPSDVSSNRIEIRTSR